LIIIGTASTYAGILSAGDKFIETNKKITNGYNNKKLGKILSTNTKFKIKRPFKKYLSWETLYCFM